VYDDDRIQSGHCGWIGWRWEAKKDEGTGLCLTIRRRTSNGTQKRRGGKTQEGQREREMEAGRSIESWLSLAKEPSG
jgi:hypothetical protein